jgi:hypothetical protein
MLPVAGEKPKMAMRYGDYQWKEMLRGSQRGADPLRLAWILSLTLMVLSLGCYRKPPDLDACTRIEVHYGSGALDYFFPDTFIQEAILSVTEREHVRSYDTWTVTDPEQIRALAYRISQGEYRGRLQGIIDDTPTDVVFYRGSHLVASFSIYPTMPTVVANRRRFAYRPGFLSMSSLDPPAIKPLKVRWECAMNLSGLLFGGLWYGRERPPCPDPNQWCDVIVQTMRRMHITDYRLDGKTRRQYPDTVIARRFACPAVHAPTDANDVYSLPDETDPSSQRADSWVSDYAMNSNCTEGSPDDMVFLFESQPGWNQHGGPELFTFDNHDPKGGCVLLNDGTVKFIRTKEELQQLRWK